MPSISVIMGVYNCTDYKGLEKSVLSVVNQTYQDWELIICDDGSTNDTAKMLDRISLLDNRIKIVKNNRNRGLASALNLCLMYSSGTFIARQDDGGDFSSPIRFEQQMEFLKGNKEYGFVGCNHIEIDISGNKRYLKLPQNVLKKDFLWNSPFSHPTVMFRKSVLDEVNGYRVSKETMRCEDYDLFMRLYAKGNIGYNLQDYLYIYVTNYDSNIRHRDFNARISEAIVRFKGYRKLHMLLVGLPFIIKPIILHVIPMKILIKYKEKFIYKR